MNQRHLKKIRVGVALAFFFLTALLFIDFSQLIPPFFSKTVLYLQFVPSMLAFLQIAGLATAGFIIVLILTLLFGRVFCSTLCPLGTLQDIVIRVAGKYKKPKQARFRYAKPHTILRYSLLAVTILTFLGGSLLLINLLDPFSNFGRIFADLVRPVYVGFNNVAVAILEAFGSYFLYPVYWQMPSLITLLFPLLLLGILIGLAATRGRLYCNTICPVGTLLGFFAHFALFKITIDNTACTLCARCTITCKASCIRLKTRAVDFSRCVACFNCLAVCPAAGIKYRKPAWRKLWQDIAFRRRWPAVDTSRRFFLGKLVIYLTGLGSLQADVGAQDTPRERALVFDNESHYPVSPPGSQNLERFTRTCSACHLCISACPTQVLQPALWEYGSLAGILQPRMDYHASFCNYECTLCSQICPTGALLPLGKADKQITQLGIARFIKKRCIVYTDNTACGACAEHCPTKAVHMMPYRHDLTIPEVNTVLCIGCGACEYACPVRPFRAIYVAGNPVHLQAEKPKVEQLNVDMTDDFPF